MSLPRPGISPGAGEGQHTHFIAAFFGGDAGQDLISWS